MTKAEFIRWANRREKAADALREARRLMGEMLTISGPNGEGAADVRQAVKDTENAVSSLALALELATETRGYTPSH
ncbi:MAG: hypothetical protein EPN98_21660 [Phenylobacterium sp.]|uniref:hypothetical protein n=1 Tax=Phenylobacterium sp. TaxID=1871053 RepID=UPI001228620B|nr:hypothetical protein [Phenylobacterium sp.]TAL29052.1 MAG: hypothetical protein EPN98_21660 [Phenylobacterium sp.]